MSDHDNVMPDTGFEAPIPELDDHRHSIAATPRIERPRRGTFDSLYGARQIENELPSPIIRVRDFEEAIIDEDGLDLLTTGRRPTIGSVNEGGRSLSPPNSVKAFAQARRRERDMSFSDPKADQDEAQARPLSVASRRSGRSRSRGDNETASILTHETAEEDVCFPVDTRHHHHRHELRIDFDYLEDFINTERAAEEARRKQSTVGQSFEDLRPQLDSNATMQGVTSDGDILDLPSSVSISEKMPEPTATASQPQPVYDNNRFSFFSSAWESTIHAAELGDLVLPGEDLRGLFELPEDEPDGVWWLNVNRTSRDEVLAICKAFGVHPLTIEDIITEEAREKIELFPSYYFASFRSFNVVDEDDGKEYEPFNIYVLVFRQGTLSFSFAPNTHASQVRKRITALKDYVSLSSDWVCYALM